MSIVTQVSACNFKIPVSPTDTHSRLGRGPGNPCGGPLSCPQRRLVHGKSAANCSLRTQTPSDLGGCPMESPLGHRTGLDPSHWLWSERRGGQADVGWICSTRGHRVTSWARASSRSRRSAHPWGWKAVLCGTLLSSFLFYYWLPSFFQAWPDTLHISLTYYNYLIKSTILTFFQGTPWEQSQ